MVHRLHPSLWEENMKTVALILSGALAITATAFIPSKSGAAQQDKKSAAPAKNPKAAPQVRTWQQEPDSFLGLKFGEDISVQLPKCAEKRTYGRPGEPACFFDLGRDVLYLRNPPSIGIFIKDVFLHVADTKYEGMHFAFPHYEYLKMLELFTARYGEPHDTMIQSYSSRGGQSLQGRVYTWNGRRVTITLNEYGSRVDEGRVNVVTHEYLDHVERKNKLEAEKNKEKL